MAYWLNIFTGTTWQEFQDAGAATACFQDSSRKVTLTKKVRPGDFLLCYMTGVSRWVGVLEVTGERFHDESRIYREDVFPLRFPVKSAVILSPEHGVPMETLRGKLSGFPAGASPSKWATLIRESLRGFSDDDGMAIVSTIRAAAANPEPRKVDPKKLKRPVNLFRRKFGSGDEEIETIVSVPPAEDDEESEVPVAEVAQAATHSEIQWRLLDLGAQLGLNVWAPRADRGRQWNGNVISEVSGLLKSLPTQFDAATNQTIENIDVLWLTGNAIVAAFEVEHTTSVYSGLLRMSDLLTMQPNIDIKLYLVGPDERYAKFTREVPRPTFASRPKPLHTAL